MNIVYKIIFLILLVTSPVYAEIDEREIDLYFSNGMMGNSESNESQSWKEYVEKLARQNSELRSDNINV